MLTFLLSFILNSAWWPKNMYKNLWVYFQHDGAFCLHRPLPSSPFCSKIWSQESTEPLIMLCKALYNTSHRLLLVLNSFFFYQWNNIFLLTSWLSLLGIEARWSFTYWQKSKASCFSVYLVKHFTFLGRYQPVINGFLAWRQQLIVLLVLKHSSMVWVAVLSCLFPFFSSYPGKGTDGGTAWGKRWGSLSCEGHRVAAGSSGPLWTQLGVGWWQGQAHVAVVSDLHNAQSLSPAAPSPITRGCSTPFSSAQPELGRPWGSVPAGVELGAQHECMLDIPVSFNLIPHW